MKTTAQLIVSSIVLIGLLGAMAFGYVMNIISLAGASGLDGFTILRAIGIVLAPLGIVLGYF